MRNRVKRPRIKRRDPDYNASKRCYEACMQIHNGEAHIIKSAKALQAGSRELGLNPFELVRAYREKMKNPDGSDDSTLIILRAAAYYLTGDHLKFSFDHGKPR